jgi:hypothetical protein
MDKTNTGWSEPRNLGAPMNSPGNEWFPTATNDGTLYFGSDREGGKGRTDIYRCRLIDGKYSAAENLGENVNSPFGEFEPYIAPDESYLIFAAAGRQDGKGQFDLYPSQRREGVWTKAVNLGDKINTAATEFAPKVSPERQDFFLPQHSRFRRRATHATHELSGVVKETERHTQRTRRHLPNRHQGTWDKSLNVTTSDTIASRIWSHHKARSRDV